MNKTSKKTKLLITIGIVLGITLILTAFICLPSIKQRVPFDAPAASYNNWDDILTHPGPITVKTLSTGTMQTKLSGIMNLKHPNAQNIRDSLIDIPVNVSIVQHRKYGTSLVDAGLDMTYTSKPYGTNRGFLVKGFLGKGNQEPGQDIASVLEHKGLKINSVFLSHMHNDHTGGIVDLPKNIRYMVGADEPYLNFGFIIQSNHLAGIKRLQEFHFNSGVNLPPLGKGVDIYGDGSFWAISSKGHSNGHVLYFVNGADEQVLLTGDACNTLEQFETAIGPGFYSSDVEKAQKVLDRIIKFKKRFAQVSLSFGHGARLLK